MGCFSGLLVATLEKTTRRGQRPLQVQEIGYPSSLSAGDRPPDL
jgi:hypothetical protein